jgi:hypothetical protein
MTIAELGAIGEFVGSIAVLATLIYLATQIRQNTRSMEDNKKFAMAQAYQARADLSVQVGALWDTDVMSKAAPSGPVRGASVDPVRVDKLSEDEKIRLMPGLYASSVQLDNTCYQADLGLLPDEIAEGLVQHIHASFYPAMQKLGVPITARAQRAIDAYERSATSS